MGQRSSGGWSAKNEVSDRQSTHLKWKERRDSMQGRMAPRWGACWLNWAGGGTAMGQRSSGRAWPGHGKMVSPCRTLACLRGWDRTGLDTKKSKLVRGDSGLVGTTKKKTPPSEGTHLERGLGGVPHLG